MRVFRLEKHNPRDVLGKFCSAADYGKGKVCIRAL